jgi:predicted nucleotidyltransferase component of viral defense system
MSGKPRQPTGLEASVRQRLANFARDRREDFQFVLTRYALERLLYRLGQSRYRDRFVLKGAMLFQIWIGHTHRPTRDLDLLGNGSMDAESVKKAFQDICRAAVRDDDGLLFDPATITVEQVREDAEYHGHRVKFNALLTNARIPIQVDIGVGDAVTPTPEEVDYPTILDFPPPRLRVYPRETVVAEKLQAMVMLGIANSRIKDFYDLHVLANTFEFDGETLSGAIAATFARRRTELPPDVPIALTQEFWGEGSKWRAFLNRNKIDPADSDYSGAIGRLRNFLLPPIQALRAGNALRAVWTPTAGWVEPKAGKSRRA